MHITACRSAACQNGMIAMNTDINSNDQKFCNLQNRSDI